MPMCDWSSDVCSSDLTWGVPLSVSYHFAFSYCSWDSQGKNSEVVCHPLLLLPPIPPSIRVFSNESVVCIRWPKYYGHLLTWEVHLSVSYLFAFSYCSWGSQGKNSEVVCHSLLQWATFCEISGQAKRAPRAAFPSGCLAAQTKRWAEGIRDGVLRFMGSQGVGNN